MGGWRQLQREIAHVMASCAMRGMRYISFPPVVFQTPATTPATEAPTLEFYPGSELPEAVAPRPSAALVVTPEAVEAAHGIPVIASLAPSLAPSLVPSPAGSPNIHDANLPIDAPQAAPLAAMRRLAEWGEPPEKPLEETRSPPAPGRLRRLSELAATESLASNAQTSPRYALLNDIAIELRPRRQRTRIDQSQTQPIGQSQNRLKPNPMAPPWP